MGISEVSGMVPTLVPVVCFCLQIDSILYFLLNPIVVVSNTRKNDCVCDERLYRVVTFTPSVPTDYIMGVIPFFNLEQYPVHRVPLSVMFCVLVGFV